MNCSIRWAVVVAAAALSGCSGFDRKDGLAPQLRTKLDQTLYKAQHSSGSDLAEALNTLAAFGEHAVEPVTEQMVESPSAQTRSNGIFVLSQIYAIPDVPVKARQAAEATVRSGLEDADFKVRLESARSLLEWGDRAGIEELLEALNDPELPVRAKAFMALRDSARSDFGYDPRADAPARQAAVERFRAHFAGVPAGT